LPKEYILSKDVRELVSNPAFEKANRTKKLESRFIVKVDAFVCLSEKEVAALSFPNARANSPANNRPTAKKVQSKRQLEENRASLEY